MWRDRLEGLQTMDHAVVSQQEWLAARTALLAQEKAVADQFDQMLRDRQALPWVKVEKDYVFDGPDGPVTLSELFDGRSQLVIQHFMFMPEWDEGCPGCSFLADHIGPTLVHLENHGVTYVAVSRAPIEKIQPYHARMEWPFRWVSSANNDFNYDFNVSFTDEQIANGTGNYNFDEVPDFGELPGSSAFYKNEAGEIFRTYSAYGRGGELTLTTYMVLDIAPLGRNEGGDMEDWMRRHDSYDHQPVNHAPKKTAVPVVSGGSGCGCGCDH